MPAFGTTQTTGVLLKWFKREGDAVAKGEALMEVETDKSTVEVTANLSGILLRRRAAEGDTVPVGQTVAYIGNSGETVVEEAIDPPPSAPAISAAAPATLASMKQQRIDLSGLVSDRQAASPAAKRIAREQSVDITALRGSGPGGAVLARDLAAPSSLASGSTTANGATTPLSAMGRITAARMSASKQTAPHFYLSMDINMTAAMAQRQEWRAAGLAELPSINDFIIFGCAQALRSHALMNAQFHKQAIARFDDIHIGFAVALDEGLVVPVVRHADRLSLQELASQSRALIDKAQNKKLTPLDYEGGTFTISNLGMLGVDSFTAIINPPQCAILAVGRVAPRVVAEDDGMAIRQMMTVTLSADHRVADGAIGARFLQSIKSYLEAGPWQVAVPA